jgi:peptidyl-prolyl cis-trans isomerase C
MTDDTMMTQPAHSSSPITTVALAGTALLAALAAGCASSPDIPEESGSSSTQYQSTQQNNESSEASDSTESTSNSSSSSTAQNRRLTAAGPSSKPNSRRSGSPGAKPSGSIPKATGPVAHVDGEPITASAFNDQINKLSKSKRINTRRLRAAAPKLIDKLIDQRLVENYLEAEQIDVSDERVDKKLDEVRQNFKNANKSSAGKVKTLADARDQMGISDKELKDSIRQSLAIQKALTTNRGVTLPSDKDVRSFYDKNKSRFMQPERVRASHILVKVSKDKQNSDKAWKQAKKDAQKLYEQVKQSDKDFATLATEHSEGPTAKKGGDLGYFTRKGMRGLEPFAKKAFNMKNGAISKPVKTQFGYHIIKRTGHKQAGPVAFEKVEDRIYQKLKKQKLGKELQSLVTELRGRAEIKKHTDNIS